MALLDRVNRAPKVEVLPDFRLRVTERLDVQYQLYKNATDFIAGVLLPWATPNEFYPNCRLIHQPSTGQIENAYKNPNDPPPFLLRVYEEIPENDRVIDGLPGVSYDSFGRKIVVVNYIQFSSGTTVYTDTVGITPAPAPNTDAILDSIEETNDGTLRRTKLTFINNGTQSDTERLLFGGKLKIREISTIGTPPATPSGYTLVTEITDMVDGHPRYKYGFANASGTGGTGGEISRQFYNAEGGAVNFNYSSPNAGDGATRCVIQYLTALSVTTNPVTLPAGFICVGVERKTDEGYALWEVTGYFAKGLVVDETTIAQTGALVIYHRVAFGTAPTAPSATIGGTVTLFEDTTKNADGYVIYERRWAEANGQASIETRGEPDGAIIVQITTLTVTASTPTSPGAGYYLIALQQTPDRGYSKNSATYKKPPPTKTFKKKIGFTKPGSAVIGGSPVQLVYNEPVTMNLLADVEVSYDTSQITDVPFTVSAYATLYYTYTPTDTGIAVSGTKALGGYLAGASGTSGTNSVFNGILCDTWSYQLGSSTPSSFSTGDKVLDVDNDPYLTAIDGTVVYRRTKVSYNFT
jgi:hypothetical protein